MQIYRSSKFGWLQTGLLASSLAIISLYTARKALGLWRGDGAKPSDPFLFGINLNITAPAFLLTLVAIFSLICVVGLVLSLFASVALNEDSLEVKHPLFLASYPVAQLDIINTKAWLGGIDLQLKPDATTASLVTTTGGKPLPIFVSWLLPFNVRSQAALSLPPLENQAQLVEAFEQRLQARRTPETLAAEQPL